MNILRFLRPEKKRKYTQSTDGAAGFRTRRKRKLTRHQMKLLRKQKHGLHKPY